MKHLGDITKINWFEVEPVDVVTGGSPCQDLSVAGKRAGLAGERSGLFMEQIRCVKELRQADVQRGRTGEFIRPRYMVWENVPGAFSSGNPKGADFAAVIEEIIKVAEPNADLHVRVPDRGWPKSGCYYAEDGSWSIAYRVHDAQYWGVPQRRKRIALLADFGGLSAAEILFDPKLRREAGGGDQNAAVGDSGAGAGREVQVEHKGLSGDFEPSGEERKEAAGEAGSCVDGNHSGGCGSERNSGEVRKGGVGINGDIAGTLDASYYKGCGERQGIERKVVTCYGMDNERRRGPDEFEEMAPSITARAGTGGNNVPCVNTYQTVTGPLMANSHPGSYCGQDAYQDMFVTQMPVVFDKETYNAGSGFNRHPNAKEDQIAPTCRADTHPTGVCFDSVVRRLTPLECERLQGYPDGWTDIGEWVDSKGKRHKEADSPRYKALGNSIALPFWKWLLKRISAQYERDATLGSLFDGIGGFPYCWESVNGKGTARWASEIEGFPVAVTKLRFGEE